MLGAQARETPTASCSSATSECASDAAQAQAGLSTYGFYAPFKTRFVQESIYESCLVSNRKQVHKAIAKHLEIDQSTQLCDKYVRERGGEGGWNLYFSFISLSLSLPLSLTTQLFAQNSSDLTAAGIT